MQCAPNIARYRSSVKNKESGNALLEMALFVPLALLFLFVAIDAGATLLEQAAVRDALRTTLNSEIQNIKANDRLLRQDIQNSGSNISIAEPDYYSEELAARLHSRVAASQARFSSSDLGRAGVRIALIRIYINPQSGDLDSTRPYQIITNSVLPEDGLEKSSISSDQFPYISMEDFIEEELQSDGVNRFVQLSGLSYRSDRPEEPTRRFASSTLVLYTEVRSIANGINQGLTSSLLGRLYALQEQQLRPLRSQS
jgi:hypothetical protein